jgi:LssY-like putative type I secretion system component LssY
MSEFRRLAPRLACALLGLLTIWLLAAYLLVPAWWKVHWSRHPVLTNGPRVTRTGSGIPGDPLNLSIIGSENNLVSALLAAGWYPADPITLKSSLLIAETAIFHRPYDDAPVSSLFLFGRREDLAFEKPVGNDARQRHHVRFWQVPAGSDSGQPYWVGAITYDRSVGFSHTTGRITHHIAPDIDAEREGLITDLQRVGRIANIDWQDNFQDPPEGRNGDGDPWKTDGRLPVITLTSQSLSEASPTP